MVQATVHVADDGVWAIGGTAGMSGAWEANRLAVRYRADGTPDRSEQLPIGSDEMADAISATSTAEGLVVAARVCPLAPQAENSPCGSPATPTLWVLLHDGGVREVELDDDLTAPIPGERFAGSISVAGAVEDRVLVVRDLGEGSIPTFTTRVGAWLVDPASGEAEAVPVPAAVATVRSLCAIDDTIYALVPDLDGGSVRGGVVIRLAGEGTEPDVLAELEAVGPVYGGGLTCLEEVLVVEAEGSPSTTFTVLRRSDGEVVGDPLTVEAWGTSLLVSGDLRSLVVTHAPETGAAWLVDGSGVHPAGRFAPSSGLHGASGAQVAGEVVDVRRVRTDPSGSGPFPPASTP
jgi:hypothetical protein